LNQSWKEIVKRSIALGFGTAYMHKHDLERAASLRVAYWAYRFLDGDDVAAINAAAEQENKLREATETQEHQHQPRVPKWLRV
jgi:hypothetical protein